MFISPYDRLNGIGLITVSGRLDSSAQEVLVDRLKSDAESPGGLGRKLLVDLSGVTHLDTVGVGQIIRSENFLKSIGCKTCWVAAQAQVRKTLARTGLDQILMICDSLNDGLDKLFREAL